MLDGISISGYRSFGAGRVTISDLAKVNFFIGKNNCGKSNILRAVNSLPALFANRADGNRQERLWDNRLDLSRNGNGNIVLGVNLSRTGNTKSKYIEQFGQLISKSTALNLNWPDSVWFEFGTISGYEHTKDSQDRLAQQIKDAGPLKLIQKASLDAFGRSGSDNDSHNFLSLELHTRFHMNLRSQMISAFRKIGENGVDEVSGRGLIQKLNQYKNPTFDEYEKQKKFFDIQSLVQTVLNDKKITIDIPANAEDIYVVINDKRLPLDSLGSGIHQLVILATAVTLESDCIFCIEEPETNLHSELQKQFIS